MSKIDINEITRLKIETLKLAVPLIDTKDNKMDILEANEMCYLLQTTYISLYHLLSNHKEKL